MSTIKEEIRCVLQMFLTNLDNTNISEEHQKALLKTLQEIASPYVSTYKAIRMTGYEKSQFYELIRQGKLPKGEHEQGSKEIRYNKFLLEQAIQKLKSEKK